MATEDNVAQDQIKAFVERILRMKEEGKAIAQDIREIYAEAKANGFDKTVLGKLVNYVEKRSNDAASLAESDAIFDLYLTAYDSTSGKTGTVRATHTHASEEADEQAAQVDQQKARLAALRADPAMSIVSAGDLKKSEQPSNLQKVQTAPTEPQGAGTPAQVPSVNVGSLPADDGIATSLAGAEGIADQQPILPETANETVGRFPVAAAPVKAEQQGVGEATREAKTGTPLANMGVTGGESAASKSKYAERGVITWEGAPPEGVIRHDYSAAFGEYGQDIAVIEEDLANAAAQPIVKNGNVILDGWARYMKARNLGIEYPVVQYDGSDSLLDVIRWNTEGRLMTSEQKFRVAQKLSREEPKRKADIYAAFELGMELA